MIILKDISLLGGLLNDARKEKPIGFVPTMGALHQGHLSLIAESNKRNLFTVCSIYVNPTQFNDKNDLKNYPRDFNRDIKLLEDNGCDLVFLPGDKDMYPEPDTRVFEFGLMGCVMEAEHRPGHFNGVAQIVTKLFDLVNPDQAFFGQKDFQQLAIIRKLAKDYSYPIEIVACPIIREDDGLAMSSRNTLLTNDQRKEAPQIYKALQWLKNSISTNNLSKLKAELEDKINENQNLCLEYIEVVDTYTLQPLTSFNPSISTTACIAVFAGKIRLIDNITLS